MRRLLITLASLALLATLAPLAAAQQQTTLQGGVTLQPLANGNLWKTGVLYGATMYAQAGKATTVKVNDIHVPGQQVLGQPTLEIYACELTSKTIAPAVRADNTNGTATCVQIGTRNVRQGQTVKINVPLAHNGKYLAIQETATLVKNGATVTGITWVETAIYPLNPMAAGAPTATTPIYAGAPISYLPLPWTIAPTTTQLTFTSEAWICPDKAPNTNTAPLSSLGCNRAFRNINTTTAATTFTLGGRVHKEETEFQYLYLVGFSTVEPDGNLPPQTYQIRSKATVIKPLPAPTPVYTTSDTTITATLAPMAGVEYRISAIRQSTGRVFAAKCLGDTAQVVCTVNVLAGQWKVSVTPTGKQAVGTPASTTLVVGAP
jgi:hypothetical protein